MTSDHLTLPAWVVASAVAVFVSGAGWCADMTIQVRSIRSEFAGAIGENQRRIERVEERQDELTDRLLDREGGK